MSLNATMIFTAVEIRNSPTHAIGTGFLMSVRGEGNLNNRWPYVVTADHVIRGESSIYVAAPDPNGSGELYEPEPVNDWCQPIPKLDLAVAPWPFKPKVPYGDIPMEKELYPLGDEHISLLGAPVHYVGLFAPAQRMMVRAGTFGAIDAKGIAHDPDFDYEYDCHLIDCRSYGGFSGSPCFVELLFVKKENWEGEEAFVPLYRALMVGMFTEHYDDSEDQKASPDEAVSRLGVGMMVRGEDIKRALLSDVMKADREKRESDLEKRGSEAPYVGPKVARVPEPTSDELKIFKSFAQDQIQTPKSNIDDVLRGHTQP